MRMLWWRPLHWVSYASNSGIVSNVLDTDGCGVMLGADGVVMGTKFIPAKESTYPEAKKRAILESKDGGSSTVK